jgi:hypothetical protein
MLAVPPQNNVAFVREVDEELRREQAERFLRRYGRMLVVAIVLLLAAVGGWLWWQHHRSEQAAAEAELLVQAFDDAQAGPSKEKKARDALNTLAGSPRDGYRAAARLTLADVALQKGDVKAAAAAFAEIANDERLGRPYRDLALIRQTATEFDTLPPGTVLARLQGLAVPRGPWFGSAGEMVAVARLKQGNRAEAGRLFAALARDAAVPETIRSRAVQMAGLLGVDATAPAAATGVGGTNGR